MSILTISISIACITGLIRENTAFFRKEELKIVFVTNYPNVTIIEEHIKIDITSVTINVIRQKEKL